MECSLPSVISGILITDLESQVANRLAWSNGSRFGPSSKSMFRIKSIRLKWTAKSIYCGLAKRSMFENDRYSRLYESMWANANAPNGDALNQGLERMVCWALQGTAPWH